MKVVITGSGNTATVLGKLIIAAGHKILQVAGRNEAAVIKLATELNAQPVKNFVNISEDADIYIIAVSDTAVAEVAAKLKKVDKLFVHTAGALSINIFKHFSHNYGVLYPLQSLRKEETYLPVIPFLIDGSSSEVKESICQFAKTLSAFVKEASDEQRLKLHLAAVITSNFTNHLYTMAEIFCKQEGVSFNDLIPLINETSQRLLVQSPSQTQTGPAIREDMITINAHLELLDDYPELKKIYRSMSDSVMNFYKD